MSNPSVTSKESRARSDLRPASVAQVVSGLGAALSPVTCVLVFLTVLVAVERISHYVKLPAYPATPDGISDTRRSASIALCAVLSVIDPLVLAFLWFDWLKTGLSRRNRLAFIGYLGGVIAAMSLVLVLSVSST